MQARNPQNAQGVDISHWQGVIDWAKVKQAGISFAIIKATEGQGMTDDFLTMNINGTKSVGMGLGVYHFCRACDTISALAEAKFFCDTLDSVGGVYNLHIPPILDIETVEAKTKESITAICHAWLEYVEKRTGIKPMIYSYPSFADDYLDASLSVYPLWLADYALNPPNDHGGWAQWEFMQFSEKGQINGIQGYVDLNEYAGSVEELLYKLPVEVEEKVGAVLSAVYGLVTTDADKQEMHRLRNELRKASGQPTT